MYALGVNQGAEIFGELEDFDCVATLLILADGAIASLIAGRYNPARYDVRMELAGSKRTVSAGLDDRAPVAPLEDEGRAPTQPYVGFLDRFRDAYRAEMKAFVALAAGRAGNPSAPTGPAATVRPGGATARPTLDRLCRDPT